MSFYNLHKYAISANLNKIVPLMNKTNKSIDMSKGNRKNNCDDNKK